MAKIKEMGCVDSDTLLAIQEGNKEVIKQVSEMLKVTTADLKEYMNLHISPLKGDVDRLRDDVSDLYDKDRTVREKMATKEEVSAISNRVGALEQRQSADEGNRDGRDHISGFKQSEDSLTWGKVAGIATIIGLIGAVIGYFI